MGGIHVWHREPTLLKSKQIITNWNAVWGHVDQSSLIVLCTCVCFRNCTI